MGVRKKVLAKKKFVQPTLAILKGKEEKQQNAMAKKWLVVQLRPYHKLGWFTLHFKLTVRLPSRHVII